MLAVCRLGTTQGSGLRRDRCTVAWRKGNFIKTRGTGKEEFQNSTNHRKCNPKCICRFARTHLEILDGAAKVAPSSTYKKPSSNETGVLIAASVALLEVIGNPVFHVGVSTVDGAAQGRFSRGAITQALQDALDIAHAIGVANVFNGGQTLIVGDIGLAVGKTHLRAFQRAERNLPVITVELFQRPSHRGDGFRLQRLCYSLVEPLRTTPMRNLVDKGVRQFVLEDA